MDGAYKKARQIFTFVALGQMVLALGIMVYGLLNHKIGDLQCNLLMGGSLLIYWLLMDVAEPVFTHRFDDIEPERKTAYFKFLVLDLVGFAGALYFLIGMNGTQSNGLLGAVVFVVTMKPKRDNQMIFYGTAPIPGSEEDEPDEEAADGTAVDAAAAPKLETQEETETPETGEQSEEE